MNNLLFRTAANAPISSMYTLYANGRGQTFWAPSVSPANLSSISTSISYQNSTIGSYIDTLNVYYKDLSTFTIQGFSTIQNQILSTSLVTNGAVNALSNQFNIFSW
jgi:hypothetical protein